MEVGGTAVFWRIKRTGDVLVSLLLLPVLVLFGGLVLSLNPLLNPGPLFYRQSRVGQHGKTFVMLKFRTMRSSTKEARFADREAHRITGFGQVLRRYRIDELPQLVNVLKGEMSLIGPRPEQPEFVSAFQTRLPGYAHRHAVRPGVSGLSQVMQGYTCDANGTRRKLALDLRYIRRSGFRLEGYIFWRTLVTIATGYGAI